MYNIVTHDVNVSVCFFKQKTAYEMRISDWSSDVCSSDLGEARSARRRSRRIGARTGESRQGVRLYPAHAARRYGSLGTVMVRERSRGRMTTPRAARAFPSNDHTRPRSEEHTSDPNSLMRPPYAVFCLKKTNKRHISTSN